MSIVDAAAILKAVEVASPRSAYELHIKTQYTRGQAPLRGKIALPRDPRTKEETILVFAEGKAAKDAELAGATFVGGAELIEKVLSNELQPTKVLCTPALINRITPKLARFLGPKGLMPAARRGTVTEDMAAAVKEAKGLLEWKGDKLGYVRAAVGRVHFPLTDVETNIRAFLKTVREAMAPEEELFSTRKKASSSILQVYLTTTQGPGIELSDVGYTPWK